MACINVRPELAKAIAEINYAKEWRNAVVRALKDMSDEQVQSAYDEYKANGDNLQIAIVNPDKLTTKVTYVSPEDISNLPKGNVDNPTFVYE